MGEQASERAGQARQRERPPVAEPGAFHSEPAGDWSDYGRCHNRRRLHHANGDDLTTTTVLPYGDVAVRVEATATTSGKRLVPFDGAVHVGGVIGARVVGDEVFHYVGVDIVGDGSGVWVCGVACHCCLSRTGASGSCMSLNHS